MSQTDLFDRSPASASVDAPSSASQGRPRLFLIDGYSNIFRAFYAIRNLSNSRGEPTNAIFGFLQILRKLLREEKPELVGVALDVSRKTVRSEKYEDYKANRAPMPEDLRPQIPWIRKVIDAYRIPILELERYEADDVLGTLSVSAAAAGYDVVLVSADKDLMQLVGPHVFMYHTGRDKLYDPALVEEDFGVPPEKVVDVLALMGDASDNVPGVPGIGEKGAKTLIRDYGSLAELLERAEEVKRKSYREGLQQHRDKAELSQDLVTIHTDLGIPFDAQALHRDPPDVDALRELFTELEFFTLLQELQADNPTTSAPAREVTDPADWQAFASELKAGKAVWLAAIGGHLDEGEAALGVAAAVAGELSGDEAPEIVYVDRRREELWPQVVDSLETWAGDGEMRLLGHDLKEVLRLLPRLSTEPASIRARLFDVMLVSYVLEPSLRGHTLAELALERLQRTLVDAKDAGWVKKELPALGSGKLLAFAGERLDVARRLEPFLRKQLGPRPPSEDAILPLAEAGAEEAHQDRIYYDMEVPLLPVLLGMEERGVELDADFLADMSVELEKEVDALEREIYELAGEVFNIGSPQQLGVILFEKLGYPVIKRTRKTKSYATGAEILEQLAAQGYDMPERVLRYREVTKLKSTYVDALPLLVAEDGRLHTRFNQAVAATGRLSSANPNLQNIPVRTELGQRIRKAFVAKEGHCLLVADYSQIELRVLAHIADEQALQEAFRAGQDIHAATAAHVFGIAPEMVSGEQRRAAKTINFGIIYGISAFGLAQNLGIPRKQAQTFIDAYLERYSGVKKYVEETLARAEEERKVTTLYGRIRWLPDIKSRNWNLRENARRMAINARIQGTAADLMKLALIAVERRLREESLTSQLLLTVHDELMLEVPEAELETARTLVVEAMEGVAQLAVPLVVDVGDGPTWYDAK